jgi:magnesium-transporting ATPase (P-type)
MVSSEVQTVSGSESYTNREADRAILNRINDTLRSTRPWTRFLSILGFIAVAILILSGIAMMLGKNFLPKSTDTPTLMLAGAVNVAVSVFYLIPSIWLYKYSSAISRFLDGGGATELGNALVYQKSFWKYVGIMILVSMTVAILGILAAVFIPSLLRFLN